MSQQHGSYYPSSGPTASSNSYVGSSVGTAPQARMRSLPSQQQQHVYRRDGSNSLDYRQATNDNNRFSGNNNQGGYYYSDEGMDPTSSALTKIDDNDTNDSKYYSSAMICIRATCKCEYDADRERLEYNYDYDETLRGGTPQPMPRIRDRGEYYVDSYNGEPWSVTLGTSEEVSFFTQLFSLCS